MSGQRNHNESTVLATVAPLLGLPSAEILSNGITTSRKLEMAPGAAGAVGGLPLVLRFEFDCPTANPAEHGFAVALTQSQGLVPSSSPNALMAYLRTNGEFRVWETGADSSHVRQLSFLGFRAAYSGKRVRGAVIFANPDSTENPRIVVNGQDITAAFSSSTQGDSPPNWLHLGLVATYYRFGWGWWAGRFVPHAPIIGTFTVAEAIEWTLTGRLPDWCERSAGHAANIIPNPGFEDTGGGSGSSNPFAGWHKGAGLTVEQETVDVYAGTTSCRLTGAGNVSITSGNQFSAAGSNQSDIGKGWVHGATVRFRCALKYVSGAETFYFGNGTTVLRAVAAAEAAEWTVFEWTGTLNKPSGYATPTFGAAAGSVWLIDAVEAEILGPIFRPVIQPAMVLADAGANVIPGILTAGMTPVCPGKRDFVLQAKTATNGNAQLFGSGVAPFIDHTKVVLRDYVAANKGSNSRTISLGTTSGGTQLVNGATAAVGLNTPALAARTLGANALFVASDGSDPLLHAITGFVVD